jgi:hypothetical protein
MKQTINLNDFRNAFQRMDRGNQFSYEALELIYDYLEEIDPDSELDVIAICCDFQEMTPREIADAYGYEVEEDGNEMQNVLDCLHDETSVIGTTDETIIFVNF